MEDKEKQEEEVIQQEFQSLLQDYINSSHRKKVEIIEKAFHFANQAHKGIRRRSGEPYIMHPLAVAKIVSKELGLGSTSICAALLHDVVEDTNYTVEDIEKLFGKKIASIVDGLTKISGGVFADKASEQAENFRKLLLTMSEDIRVVLIKMADRLHNMRTLSAMPPQKQYKITGETQYIYAPLAHRLGLFAIKTELENLSFRYEHPEIYKEIEQKLQDTEAERKKLYQEFSKPVSEKLTELNYKYEITARIKSIFSIWNKMQKKNIPFSEIYDILALRVVFDGGEDITLQEEKEQCWLIYSAITSIYKPHPERTRDWVSTPKSNGYEALHVTVMAPDGHWVEVQIRSKRMDEIAEKGFAAHWKYKIGKEEAEDESELDKWLKTIKELLENPDSDAIDFLDTFKLNLYADEIFVFTPKGDIKTLPKNATALDFAFYLHSDIGTHCIGAKVNHKLVPLSYQLKSGDQIEILTSKKQKPQAEWINFVTTARAKTKIKELFKNEYRGFIKKGKKEFDELSEKAGLVLNKDDFNKILLHFDVKDEEKLYYRIGKGKITQDELKEQFKTPNRLMKFWKLQFFNTKSDEKNSKKSQNSNDSKRVQITEDEVGVSYEIAKCCNPIPGDDTIGFRNASGIIEVHKRDCPNARELQAYFGDRIVVAEWTTYKELSFPAVIEIKGYDSVGVLSKILKVISDDHEVNIHKVEMESNDGMFSGKISVYVRNVESINNLCMTILNVSGVEVVNRVD